MSIAHRGQQGYFLASGLGFIVIPQSVLTVPCERFSLSPLSRA